jgi:hypothetical protein
MGFGSPKAVKQDPAPPPVTTTSADVARAQLDAQRTQDKRNGYQDTVSPTMSRKTLLSKPNTITGTAPRKTLLSTR